MPTAPRKAAARRPASRTGDDIIDAAQEVVDSYTNFPPEVTPLSEWKTKRDEPIELPSGKFIRMRSPGFRTFIKNGMIPNALMAPVQSALAQGGNAQPDMSGMGDLENMEEMYNMVDSVVVFCAIEPVIHEVPTRTTPEGPQDIPLDERDATKLYVDEIDETDRMFMFGVATGGTRDLETFRNGLTQQLAPVPAS